MSGSYSAIDAHEHEMRSNSNKYSGNITDREKLAPKIMQVFDNIGTP